jgi:hypothetical protein
MSHIRIDKQKAVKKWTPVLENMGVSAERVEWMSEMAEYHSINENAYVNASNVAGMGAVTAAQPSSLAGSLLGSNWSGNGNGGSLGSGDVGQNLLPVAMKIAAQTIGLDLVAVKPTPGPKIDLLYIDFQYDDTTEGERPQVFIYNNDNATVIGDIKAAINLGLTTSNISVTTVAEIVIPVITLMMEDHVPNIRFNVAATAGCMKHFTDSKFAAIRAELNRILKVLRDDNDRDVRRYAFAAQKELGFI